MSLEDLQPTNTKRAKAGAVNTFMRFLAEENVTMEAVDVAVRGDPSGSTLVAVVDRFGLYLAHYKTSAGNALARHSVMQYFRQAKMWLLDRYPRLASLVEKRLLKKGKTLEGFWVKRPTGKMVKQASACTKSHLRLLMRYLYSTASVDADFQDAGLLSLLWFLSGRASDLTLLQKSNLSLCSESVFFVRFVRMKTSEEQGLTLHPDTCPLTCPLTAIAVALIFQTTPSIALLPHLPVPTESDLDIGPLPMLSAILAGRTTGSLLDEGMGDVEGAVSGEARGHTAPGIHAYVNRVLNRIVSPAGVSSTLSSHSFRRGSAQHANASADLSLQWITDRGGWNLTTMNKALAYIFNTTKEDQKVAKVLSDHDVNAKIQLHSLDRFDSVTRPRVDRVVVALFASCVGMQDTRMNINSAALSVLAAHLIRAVPQLKALAPEGPLAARVDEALRSASVEYEEFLAWSSYLGKTPTSTLASKATPDTKDVELLQHQAAVIDELINLNKKLSDRIRKIEELNNTDPHASHSKPVHAPETPPEDDASKRPYKRRKSASTSLVDAWYKWFTMSATARESLDTKTKSDLRQVVAFMRLFSHGYVLDPRDEGFRDTTLRVANETAANVYNFLAERRVTARSTGTVLKEMRALHRQGVLNERIANYKARLTAGIVVDPSPPKDLNYLETVPVHSASTNSASVGQTSQ